MHMAEISQLNHKNRRTSIRIDMTPLVDLAFLLLTFFILATKLQQSYMIQINFPGNEQPAPKRIKSEQLLTLVLGEKNKIYWYTGEPNQSVSTTDFSQNGIRKVLFDKNNHIQDMFVLIKPTDKTQYQNIVDIVDELQITNIKNYAFAEVTRDDRLAIKDIN